MLNTKMKKIMAVALSCVVVIGAVATVQLFGGNKLQPPSATEVPLNTKEVLSAVDGEEDGEVNPELDVDPELAREEEEKEARREAEREARKEAEAEARKEAEEAARKEAEEAAKQEEIIVEAPQPEEATDEPLPEETPEPAAERSVTITSTLTDQINEGEMIEMEAELVGFDGVDIELQWQYNDGTEWQDAEDGNGTSYEIIANAQTVNYNWRIKVTIAD